ncbi:MAG: hypothetical protein UT30_C0025G0003 [Candidatus Uhrbacteria bacterium GW2011_GWF2_39_13]|uniref:Leucyl aminopeptidase (Aminopeptidase T) n=1 Tax=Candidatus Uhrbacteria bacterium GW2011_GWF2_39_13 TaxID=1618995 RepID=A0A0G0MT57_9BACT|nr:MAG: hypothetical protein UT30_C0025G0003 [Candidatus Uhrbacteria bacterium GW2011_GWF2_39_13]
MTENLEFSARRAFLDYLKVLTDEKVFLVYDNSTEKIARAFNSAASNLKLNLSMRKIEINGGNGQDPDAETCRLMSLHDVIIAPTFFSLTHCAAVKKARKTGARVATLPGITEDVFVRGLKSSPEELDRAGEAWMKKLAGNHSIRVCSAKGTDISFTVGKALPGNDNGCIFEKGSCQNLPSGEVYMPPDPDSGDGVLVIDGSIATQEMSDGFEPVTIKLRGGSAYSFEGKRAEDLKKKLQTFGSKAFVLAEFGIGTNSGVKLSGNLLEDEKVKGTVHFAFGNNTGFGGINEVPVHIDCIVTAPDIFVDGVCCMRKGEWLI